MRVGLVAPPWLSVPPAAYGGIEAVIDSLARGLVAAGHDVLLAASSDSTCPVPLVPGLERSDPSELGTSLPELRHIALAYAAMGDVDVIHDHTLAGPLYRNRQNGVPVVTTVHGPFIPAMLDVYRAIDADTSIIAISRHQASTAIGLRIAGVIHHGIDTAPIPVGDGRGGYACFLGRMHESKGVVEAIRIAREAGVPLRIAAKIGELIEREYFDCAVRPLLGPDCEYVGQLGPRDKFELLGGAIALLNPIQWAEPFGMVMIEALAAGTPVVCTRRGSAPEIVEDGVTGFLRDGEKALAECLPMAAELDRAGCRAAAEARFSQERMTRDHLMLYESL